MTESSVDLTSTELIDIWREELTDIVLLCESLTDEQWLASTPCPGWTVADVIAHLIDVESMVAADPRPDHVPDWAGLPHATTDFGRLTEVGVDYRRGRTQDELLDELTAIVARRQEELLAIAPGTEVKGPTGASLPIERMLRVRIFDAWVHEQDIRTALGSDGGWGSDAAWVALMQMVAALPFIWARKAKAPAGAVLRLVIVGGGPSDDVFVTVDEAGMGSRTAPMTEPVIEISMTWPAFMQLSCGRIGADDPALIGKVEVNGDPKLGHAVLAGLAITP